MTSTAGQASPDWAWATKHKARVERAAARSALWRGLIAAVLLAAGILGIVARLYLTGLILIGLAATVGVLFLDAMLHKNEVAERPAKYYVPNLSALLAASNKPSDSAKADLTK